MTIRSRRRCDRDLDKHERLLSALLGKLAASWVHVVSISWWSHCRVSLSSSNLVRRRRSFRRTSSTCSAARNRSIGNRLRGSARCASRQPVAHHVDAFTLTRVTTRQPHTLRSRRFSWARKPKGRHLAALSEVRGGCGLGRLRVRCAGGATHEAQQADGQQRQRSGFRHRS